MVCLWILLLFLWRNRFFILSPRMSDGPLRPPWHIFAHTGHNQSRRKIILCSAPQGFWSSGRQLKHKINCGLNQKSPIYKTVYYIENSMYKIRWIYFLIHYKLSLFEGSIVKLLIAAKKWPFKWKMGFIFPISVTCNMKHIKHLVLNRIL